VYNLIMREKKSWRAVLPVKLVDGLLLTAMVVCFTREISFDGKAPFFRDLASYFYPMRFILYESFEKGELPLWNSNLSMGFPFLANPQTGVFYPPHALFFFFPFFTSIRLLFVLHFLIAASGSYLLLRQWAHPRWLALTGAALFTFSGIAASLTNLLDHFQSAVWLPWALLSCERAMRNPALREIVFLTVVLLAQFLAGSPEIYGLTVALLFANSIRLKAENPEISWRSVVSVLLLSNAFAAGIAAVQILPSAELFFHSWRSSAIAPEQAMMWSLHPLRLLNLFFLDKEVNLYAPQGLHLFFGRELPLVLSLYLGAICLPGVGLWLLHSSLKEKTITTALLSVVLIVSMGQYTPVYPFLLDHFPLLGFMRFPEKSVFMATAIVHWMVIAGIGRFYRTDHPSAWKGVSALFMPVVGLLMIYLLLRLNLAGLVESISAARQSAAHDVSTLRVATSVLVNLERQMLLTLGIAFVLWLWKDGRLKPVVAGCLLFVLTFSDLYTANHGYLFAVDPSAIYQKPKILDKPSEAPSRLFYNHDLSYLDPDSYRFRPRPFPETVAAISATLIPNTGIFHGFEYMQELESLARIPYYRFLQVAGGLAPENLFRLLGILNVKYVTSAQPLPLTLLGYFPDYPAWLYEIESAVPRAYMAHKVIVESDPKKVMELLSTSEFRPLKEVILEKPAPVQEIENFRGEAKISRYTSQSISIDTSLNGPGVLVLTESFYPGWEVRVDGEEAELRRANYFFRGVLVPAGKHHVEFRYAPYSFKLGLAVSLGTLGLIALLLLARKKFGL
jgi:hypothetical protein